MMEFFVNLKRFDIPKSRGGICPSPDPIEWIRSVISKTVSLGLAAQEDITLVYLLPEGLLAAARERLAGFHQARIRSLTLGCQGVFWEDVGQNFGAFTSHLPASAAKSLGCSWAMVGHSEERKAKGQIISEFASRSGGVPPSGVPPDEIRPAERRPAECRPAECRPAVSRIINRETLCALRAGLHVLLCLGETEEERGEGDFGEQKPRIEEALTAQLAVGLTGVASVWAIGPGKTPPDTDYIRFVSSFIKAETLKLFGFEPPVVYGGGLKKENAREICRIDSIDGGLVALTRFSGDIGFSPEGLKEIIEEGTR
jgi:triosephosphate isomerase